MTAMNIPTINVATLRHLQRPRMVVDRRPVVDTVNRVDEVDCFTGPMGRLAPGNRTP
jgi:hypothetical protein